MRHFAKNLLYMCAPYLKIYSYMLRLATGVRRLVQAARDEANQYLQHKTYSKGITLMNLQIYRAESNHAEKIAPLFDAYQVFYGQTSNLLESYNYLDQRLKLGESTVFYAQDNFGELLGFVQLYPTFSSVSARRTWVLNDLFTVESGRGQGVGRALLEMAKSFVISTGAKGIYLETGANNKNAQRLYESQGYVKDSGYYSYYLDFSNLE